MDIKRIVEKVKETILKDGDHHPMIIVEFEDEREAIIFFEDMPDDPHTKHLMFFNAGRKVGSEIKLAPSDVCMISEAWTSTEMKGNGPKYTRPSEDPNRKESLIIARIQIQRGPEKSQLESSIYAFEMLRDGSGELMDLLAQGEYNTREVSHPLLMYFLGGIAGAGYSDRELMSIVGKFRR